MLRNRSARLRRASSTPFFGDLDDGEAFGKVSASKILQIAL